MEFVLERGERRYRKESHCPQEKETRYADSPEVLAAQRPTTCSTPYAPPRETTPARSDHAAVPPV
jgi:hypothetical protein